jgi:hypothetical protein
MSLNIAPHIPQVIANSAAPATESLARANAVREVVPAPTQVEAAVPQKSREQDTRPPSNQDAVTYEGIQQKADPNIIPDNEQHEQDSQQEQSSAQQNAADDEATEVSAASEGNGSSEQDQQEAAENKAEQRVEEAQHRAELAEIRSLERRDAEVRAHEQAHAAVGGGYAGSPSYDYEAGPNGKKYAVSGEVSIDVSAEDTPQETIQKMQTVRAAALAPAEPSSQDRKVAAEASQKLAEARAELISQNNDLQTTRAAGLEDDKEESQSVQVNTDNPIGQEPSKRSLALADQDDKDASSNEVQQSETAQLAQRDQSVERTAYVVSQRYASSFQAAEQGFNAVA